MIMIWICYRFFHKAVDYLFLPKLSNNVKCWYRNSLCVRVMQWLLQDVWGRGRVVLSFENDSNRSHMMHNRNSVNCCYFLIILNSRKGEIRYRENNEHGRAYYGILRPHPTTVVRVRKYIHYPPLSLRKYKYTMYSCVTSLSINYHCMPYILKKSNQNILNWNHFQH